MRAHAGEVSLSMTSNMPSAGVESAVAPAPLDDWPPLELYDLHKRWRRELPLLEGIDLTLESGEVAWIGGRNGAGKTTLLRIIAGLIDPDSGEVRAYGMHPFRQRREFQRRVAFLSAGNTGVYARLTVLGQLDCWARVSFVPRAEREQRVKDTLRHFGLEPLAGNRSDRLSMGQRQRLRIAMTFIARPEVVLLDEPRNSLDGEGAEMLHAAIRGTVQRGGAVLWVSPTGEPVTYDFDSSYLLEQGTLQRA
jgi:heme ABC exporter ATP-binding subunit CcmA